MKFKALQSELVRPLQAVIGVVERRQTMPILSNVLISAQDGQLNITATDLEVELVTSAEVEVSENGDVTVPGRKLLDICRALPNDAKIDFTLNGDRVTVRSGKSRFNLSTLPGAEFPVIDDIKAERTLALPKVELKRLLEKTHFSMAQQDVRYYLNGLLFEIEKDRLRAVATDGHRLAMCETDLSAKAKGTLQVIVPRKGVLELQRLLVGDGDVELSFGTNHVRAQLDNTRFTSKLIDGRFPEYDRVIPKTDAPPVKADRDEFRTALKRAAILSNEKYRGIRLSLKDNSMVIQANNPEHEEAEEEIAVNYDGEGLEIGFNANYLQDALGAIDSDAVEIGLKDSNSSCLIREPGSENCKFVVMPMRL